MPKKAIERRTTAGQASGIMGDEYNRRGSVRTGPAIPTRIGAKRDQYGNLLPTPQAPQNSGQLSAAHDFGAFDAVFHPVKEEAKPVVAKVAPPVAAAHIRTNGATNASVPTMTTSTTVANPPNVTAPAVTRPTASGGIANPPPMSNARPGQSATASLAPQVPTKMKAIPAPVTSPTGDKNTDAFNLAQNKAIYAPGGMTEQPNAPRVSSNPAVAPVKTVETPSVADAYAIQNRYQTKGTVAKLTPGSVRDIAGAGGFPRVGPLAGQPPAATGVAGPAGAPIPAQVVQPTAPAPAVAQPVAPTPEQPPAPTPAPMMVSQPSEPITPNSVGQAIHNTPGAIADVAGQAATGAAEAYGTVKNAATEGAVRPAVTGARDFVAGVAGSEAPKAPASLSGFRGAAEGLANVAIPSVGAANAANLAANSGASLPSAGNVAEQILSPASAQARTPIASAVGNAAEQILSPASATARDPLLQEGTKDALTHPAMLPVTATVLGAADAASGRQLKVEPGAFSRLAENIFSPASAQAKAPTPTVGQVAENIISPAGVAAKSTTDAFETDDEMRRRRAGI